ncbi:MAG: glutamate racemase [Pseudomonadota bacterium]|nr:MAG: glutamate racemase [Desulfobacteraceae bacterium]
MIGIFDSGLGGLTVVRAVMKQLPEYDIVYFGDTARTPYGTKSRKTVIGYSFENTDFLVRMGAKMIIIACNTASSFATHQLSEAYKLPIFEVITPAIEKALSTTRKYKIGVIGTRATISSNIYEQKIMEQHPEAHVYSSACPLLVPLVEEGWLSKPETRMIVKKYLLPLKGKQIDTLILGCTHYPLLKDIIQHKIGKRVNIIDSSISIASRIKTYIQNSPEIEASLSKNGQSKFYVSDITDQFKLTAQKILKKTIHLEHVIQ